MPARSHINEKYLPHEKYFQPIFRKLSTYKVISKAGSSFIKSDDTAHYGDSQQTALDCYATKNTGIKKSMDKFYPA